MQEDKTYLITNIEVLEVAENQAYWDRKPEMHPIKNNEPIRNIEPITTLRLRPAKFLRDGKIFSIALPPELQEFFCLPFEEFNKMDETIKNLTKLINSKELNYLKNYEYYCQNMENMQIHANNLNDEIGILNARLNIKQSSLQFALETAEKYCKAVFQINHAGFLKRLKYLFTGKL